jgi:hypothetical protein
MKTPHVKLIGRSPLRRGFLRIALALACLTLLPQARAVCQDACLTSYNTVQGEDALLSLTSGHDNTAIGFNALFSNTTGTYNTATGSLALENNTTGNSNTATGVLALEYNTTGHGNTATGDSALWLNTTGFNNTAHGVAALTANTTGDENTASGSAALQFNTTGNNNTATGAFALWLNGTGANNNTATGSDALMNNSTGISNTATGFNSLSGNTTGSFNTADGKSALANNTGSNNTAIGLNALFNNTTGSNNIALGISAGISLTTGSNNIAIGAGGVAAEANTIRLGKSGIQQATYIAGISGKTVAAGVSVVINGSGLLGTVVSSARFKEAIKPMDKASEAILALKPVTFRYKQELDPDGIPQFGLVAEQVEKVNPDLVARDDQGKPYTVRYEAVNAMLLNEFLKEHRKVEEQGVIIAKQQKQIEALTAGLQKVSAQVEMSRRAPQMVNNN